jgi:hypothetical protein
MQSRDPKNNNLSKFNTVLLMKVFYYGVLITKSIIISATVIATNKILYILYI